MLYLLYKHQWNAKKFHLNIFCYKRCDLLCSHSNSDLFICKNNMLFSHVKIIIMFLPKSSPGISLVIIIIILGYHEFYIEFPLKTTYLFQTHDTWNSLLVQGTFGLLWFRIWPWCCTLSSFLSLGNALSCNISKSLPKIMSHSVTWMHCQKWPLNQGDVFTLYVFFMMPWPP